MEVENPLEPLRTSFQVDASKEKDCVRLVSYRRYQKISVTWSGPVLDDDSDCKARFFREKKAKGGEAPSQTAELSGIIISSMLYILPFLFSLCTVAVASEDGFVTCGSVIKLRNKETNHHLHSHSIAWGSGSGQQSVTGHGSSNDVGSSFMVKHGQNEPFCTVGTAVKCGMKIRLEHIQTGKNVHSHLFRAALTGNQEVSGFGEGGVGDTGDNWSIQCSQGDDLWRRGSWVELKHVDTGKFLYTSSRATFNAQNCGGGCPIMGQTEVSSSGKKSDGTTKWATGSGVYYPSKEEQMGEDDDEL